MITKEDLKQQIEGAKNDIVSCINERMDKLELRDIYARSAEREARKTKQEITRQVWQAGK